jgi:hypothetical protein
MGKSGCLVLKEGEGGAVEVEERFGGLVGGGTSLGGSHP